ncbi:hypothetical protein [Levilactobacillus andaensis]|uniref:hypothetical protein n=1 Tax=Levilactobacillus andaensis TaxID=2799570 RepID=UPI0019422CDF|nr:hypothetical protein [Levilactobacillus andaensis]
MSVEGQRVQNPVSVLLGRMVFPALEEWPIFETRVWRLKVALETALWLQVCLTGWRTRWPKTK